MDSYLDKMRKDREQEVTYVNSGTGKSRDELDDFVAEINANGSIGLNVVQNVTGDPAIDIVGRIAIREYIQEETGWGKRQANNVFNSALLPKGFMKEWREIPCTCTSSLDAFCENYRKQASANRTANLPNNKQSTVITIPSSGQILK